MIMIELEDDEPGNWAEETRLLVISRPGAWRRIAGG